MHECKAKAKVLAGEIVGRTSQHAHRQIAVWLMWPKPIKVGGKRQADDALETPQQIITQTMSTLRQNAVTEMPAMRSIRRAVHAYNRGINGIAQPLPPNARDMDIPDVLTCKEQSR